MLSLLHSQVPQMTVPWQMDTGMEMLMGMDKLMDKDMDTDMGMEMGMDMLMGMDTKAFTSLYRFLIL